MSRKVDVSSLRDEAALAVERGKLDKAIELYAQLEEAEPATPLWPKRLGETHRRADDRAAAIEAFERAAEKYAIAGFLVQAIAVCKLILQLDPEHSATQARLSGWVKKPPPRLAATPAVRAPGPPPAPAPPAPPAPPPAHTPRQRAVLRPPEPPPVFSAPPPEQPLPKPVPRLAMPMPPSDPSIEIEIAEPSGSIPVELGDSARAIPIEVVEPSAIRIELAPGDGLDSIDLSTLIPGTAPVLRADGKVSGVNVLPLGEPIDLESIDDAEPVTERTPGRAARRALLTTPLFPEVSPRVLERLIARMSLIDLAAGEVLFREGETGHELFVISDGEVSVSTGNAELARLGPSAFFGEIALITNLPRSATIRAITPVELLAIDREVIRDAAADHPEIITVLLRFVRDRLIDRITRTSELFRPFTEGERRALSSKFELVEVVPDAVLITQGERADGLYLVVSGKVEVWRDGEPALARLGTGDVFGELSLLAGGGSVANVRSVTRVLALRMPATTFREVIMTHPQVLAYLGELAERRSPKAQAESFVDLHLDMLM